MQFSKPLATIVAGLLAIALTACSGDDDAIPDDVTDPPTTTTEPPSTTATPPSTSPPTSVTVTTPPPTEPPTTPPPSTTIDDVKAQIQADLSAGRQRLRALQMAPTLDGLEETMATIALPGSEYYQQQVDYINELVSLGDVVTLGDPPVDSITVEEVTFEGPEPYAAASVKVCDATNLGRITPAENSPVSSVVTMSDPELRATRYSLHVVSTELGWVRDTPRPRTVDAAFPGQATCS
jgi:hypothetical protein